MAQSSNSHCNASTNPLVKAQSLRRSIKAYGCALALALGALGGDASAAQQGDGAGSAPGSKGEQAAPADSKPSQLTPAQRTQRAKRRADRAAAKKGEARPVDEKDLRVATALSQIAAAVESGQLTSLEAFRRIEEVKKSWVKMERSEAGVAQAGKQPARPAGEAPVAAPIIEGAAAAAAARKKAARLEAAAARDAKAKSAVAGSRDGAKPVAASAPRKAPVSVKPVAAPDKNLSTLVVNYNAAEKLLNEKVVAGEMSRQAANRQLEKIRNDLRVASGAAAQGNEPEDTTRYKNRERDLGREVARGLTSARDAQRELRLLRRAIASEQQIQKAEAKRADELHELQQKLEAKEKWEAEQARAAAQRKANQQKRANRKKKAATQSDG